MRRARLNQRRWMWRFLGTKVWEVKQREPDVLYQTAWERQQSSDFIIWHFPTPFHDSGWGVPKVDKRSVWISQEVPVTGDGQNNFSLGTECSILINWREYSKGILENANLHPTQNSICLHVYHDCLEKGWWRDLGSSLCYKYLIHSLLYSLFVGLRWCARCCENSELESEIEPAPPLVGLFDLQQYFSSCVSSSVRNLKIVFP